MKETKVITIPMGWIKRSALDDSIIDWTNYNIYDLSIEDDKFNDSDPLKNKADLAINLTYENNEITLIQHMKVEPTEWLDKEKKYPNQTKLGKNFIYDLNVKDLDTGIITIYKVDLVRVEACKSKVQPVKSINSDNPFDVDF